MSSKPKTPGALQNPPMDVFLLIAAPKRFQVVPISGWASRLIQAEALHTKAQPTEVKRKLGIRKFLYEK
jgi:hypothetical protein